MGWWGDSVPEETLSRDEASRVLRRLFRMLRPQRALIALATLVLMGQAGALLAGPALVRHGIDAGLLSNGGKGDAAIVLVARVGEAFLRDLRNRLFGHTMSLSLDFFETEKTGKIVARMTSDIDALQELISQGLVLFVQNIFLFTGAVIVVLVLSWQLAIGVLIIVPPVFFASRWFRRGSNQAYLEGRGRLSTNLSTLQESLQGVRGVQGVGRGRQVHKRFPK